MAWVCDALEVSATGCYAWLARSDSEGERRRQRLVTAMQQLHAEVTRRYGRPRMTAELNARRYECSANTVAERTTAHGIAARIPRRFVRTTDSSHRRPVAPNLLARAFEPSGMSNALE